MRTLAAVLALTFVAPACHRTPAPSSPGTVWDLIADAAALQVCRDSSQLQHKRACHVELQGGRVWVFSDSTGTLTGFGRVWDYPEAAVPAALRRVSRDLQARWGPGRQCGSNLIWWRAGQYDLILATGGPDEAPLDRTKPVWAVEVTVRLHGAMNCPGDAA